MGKTVEETVVKTVEKSTQLILNQIKRKPNITTKELEAITGLTRRGIEYQLKKEECILRLGGAKGGYWVIV